MLVIDDDKFKFNTENLYIGGHSNYSGACQISYYLDSLKIYNRVMPQYEIQAEAGLVLGSVEPNFIQLGCFDCLFKEAQSSCITNYHLCNNVEMYSGVYQAVRIMGWVNEPFILQLPDLI
jgi:hypothetical protein